MPDERLGTCAARSYRVAVASERMEPLNVGGETCGI
jgi:hypothetical protein